MQMQSLTLALCCGLGLVMMSQAQTEDVIVPSQALAVTAEQPATLEFTLDEAARLTVAVTAASAEFDPTLALLALDEDSRRVAYADDTFGCDGEGAWQALPCIGGLDLPAGDYRVVLDSFNGVSVGEVTLEVRRDAASSPAEAGFMRLTQRSGVYTQRITLKAGETLRVVAWPAYSGQDPRLTLYFQDTPIARADDHARADLTWPLLAADLTYTAEQAGEYVLLVSEAFGRPQGIRLQIGAP